MTLKFSISTPAAIVTGALLIALAIVAGALAIAAAILLVANH